MSDIVLVIDSMDRLLAELSARRGVPKQTVSIGRHRHGRRRPELGLLDVERRQRQSAVFSAAVAVIACTLVGTLSSSALLDPSTVNPAAQRVAAENQAGDPGAPLAVADPTAPGAPAGDTTPPAAQQVALTTSVPDERARIAIATAKAQLGLPYVWGGNGPTNGDAGFDCSGLTTFSYRAAGVSLPRTAHTQYYAGPRVTEGTPLQPGDLVFYGTPQFVHHVGMYLGDGRMINAPRFGKPVQTAFYRWNGDDYLGASRPAATGQPGVPPAQPAPAPVRPPNAPDVFEAPPAPATGPLPEAVAAAVAIQAATVAPTTTPAPTSAPVTAALVAPGTPSATTPPTTTPTTSTTSPSTSSSTPTSTTTSSATSSSSAGATSTSTTVSSDLATAAQQKVVAPVDQAGQLVVTTTPVVPPAQ